MHGYRPMLWRSTWQTHHHASKGEKTAIAERISEREQGDILIDMLTDSVVSGVFVFQSSRFPTSR